MLKMYIAGPVTGLTGPQALDRFEARAAQMRNLGYNVLHPLIGKEWLRDAGELAAHGYDHPLSNDHAILARDRWMVRWCDVLCVDVRGAQRVSIGTVAEMAWAHADGKHIILLMEVGNIHEHAFVLEMASIRFFNEPSAWLYLEALAGSEAA